MQILLTDRGGRQHAPIICDCYAADIGRAGEKEKGAQHLQSTPRNVTTGPFEEEDPMQGFTLAMYRVRGGQEGEFIAAWNTLADTFLSLPRPPLWGTLIRHISDRTLFYSFGPWRSAEDVQEMRRHPQALAAFAHIKDLCQQMSPGDYEIVTQIEAPRPPPSV
jgi:hypothetical protein